MKKILVLGVAGLLTLGLAPAASANDAECVPQAAVEAVYETVVVTPGQPEIAAKDAVYETVVTKEAVAEVSHVEYKFIQKTTRKTKWNSDPNWNPGKGWYKGQETRVVIDTPAQEAVTEQRLVSEAVAYVPAVAEVTEQRLVSEAKSAVTCPPPAKMFAPVTIDWLLAPGSTEGAPFAGGDQTRYTGSPVCGGVIQRDTYFPENDDEKALIASLGDTLSRGEDFGVAGVWLDKNYVFYSLPDCEEPPVEEPPVVQPPSEKPPVEEPVKDTTVQPAARVVRASTPAPQSQISTLPETGVTDGTPWFIGAAAAAIASGAGLLLLRRRLAQ